MIEHPADSVLCHLDSARSIAQQLNNEELLFMVENYRASFYDYIKEYDLAKSTLYNAFKQYPAHTPNADDYFLMSRIYYNTGQLDSALYILDKYYAPLCQTHSDRETLSLFRSQIYRAKCDYVNAYNHIFEYIRLVTSSGLLQQDKSINELEKKYRTELLREKSRSLATRNTLLTLITLMAALIATLFIYLYIRQRQLRKTQYLQLHMAAQQEIDEIQSQYDTVKEQLHSQLAQKQLYENALHVRIENLHTLTNISSTYELDKEKFYHHCRSYINVCNQTENSFVRDIRTIASLYCEGFVETLQSRYPDLTDEDINLACLILLGFDCVQTQILFNHKNIQSTYSKRTRLRKKLGLDKDGCLEDYLSTFLQH
jgi:tetratricopeptide (TPR) repeat protein